MADPVQVKAALAELLSTRKTLQIATAGGEVSPWLAGAFFVEAGVGSVGLVLVSRGKTLANVRASPRVALMVAGATPFELFAQAQGTALIVDGDAALQLRERLKAKAPEVERFYSLPLAHVEVSIDRWLVTDVVRGWMPAAELRPGA